jgi:putative transposase
VRRALAALFGGTVGKDIVSRTWRKVKSDWDAWNIRSLGASDRAPDPRRHCRSRAARPQGELDLAPRCPGVRADGQKALLAIKSMGRDPAVTAAGVNAIAVAKSMDGRYEVLNNLAIVLPCR